MCMHHIFEASATVEESEPCAIIGRTDCSKYHGRAVALAGRQRDDFSTNCTEPHVGGLLAVLQY